MGLFDDMSERQLRKMKEAEFIKRTLSSAGSGFVENVNEVIDTETGVRYICMNSGGLTPRLNRDGTVMTVDMSEFNKL